MFRLLLNIGFLIFWVCSSMAQDLDPAMVLKKLLRARGEIRNDYPSIRLIDRVKNIAAYIPSTNEIVLERKAIENCVKFGEQAEAALAFIISHELTHFFQHRVWSSSQDEIAFFSSKSTFDRLKPYEVQADTYGAFLCYLAGYNYFQIAPAIIKELYASYQFDVQELSQYPHPEERMALTLSVCNQVDRYVLYFEAAKVLSHFGYYNQSQALLTYLLKYLDFKELYNNTAVNQLKLVMSQIPEALQYPMVVKPALSLRIGLSLSLDSLLLRAHENLTIATRKDPTDHDLFINLASVKLQLGWIDQFNQLSDQLSQVNMSEINRERLSILQAILLYKQQQRNEAIQLFRKTKSSSKHAIIRQTCSENLDRIKNKFEAPLINSSDNSTFFPPEVREPPYLKETIDQSDPLFPMTCILTKKGKTVQIKLQWEKEKLTLWLMPAQKTNHSNCFPATHTEENYVWYIR